MIARCAHDAARVAACAIALHTASSAVFAQPETLLPRRTMVGLANTVSGSRALANLIDFTGHNRDRDAAEFAGTYLESELFARKAREYGFSDVEIKRYKGRPVWDGIKGELWVVDPVMRKIVDFKDIPTALAAGSATGDYEGEMVWIENGSDADAYKDVDVEGKIVLTEASTGGAFRQAMKHGALGVVNMNSPRKYELPHAIQWNSIARSARSAPDKGFTFNISGPMLEDIRRLARQYGKLTMKAVVESAWRDADNEVITAVIPGDGSTDEWVYYSAHVFEGINKQGAADDGSGAVTILEAGRAILEAIKKGYVHRPARNMRFIWVDEFSGTFAFLDDHPDELAKVVADINIDMIGQAHNKGNNSDRLYRMPDSRIHFVSDAAEEFFDWLAATNIEHVHTRNISYYFSYPIVDPNGTRDAFRYVIEPFYGSSDHQVYNDRGIPAILFNHWPDMAYHTSHDRTNLMDATQMKRGALLTAATGLVAAGAPEVEPMQVASEAMTRGEARIAANMRSWMRHLSAMKSGDGELGAFMRDFHAAARAWRKREARNVLSTLELTHGSTSTNPDADAAGINALASQMRDRLAADQAAIDVFASNLAASRGVSISTPSETDAQREAKKMVPRWKGARPAFVRVRARGLRGFSSMEVRNFIDSQRDAMQIRDAVNSEYAMTYGIITLDAVVNYLKALEKSELIELMVK